MAEEKKGFFKRLVSGLTKTRDNIVAGFDSLFTGYSTIDDDFYEELEEILIMGDIGINATTAILDKLKDQVEIRNIRDPKECKQLLIDTIKEQMTVDSTEYEFENRKSVILVIGVNGVGKTTSVGKLAGKLKDQGKKVILGAADTFRAAAGEQLTQWANRAGVEIIGGFSHCLYAPCSEAENQSPENRHILAAEALFGREAFSLQPPDGRYNLRSTDNQG